MSDELRIMAEQLELALSELKEATDTVARKTLEEEKLRDVIRQLTQKKLAIPFEFAEGRLEFKGGDIELVYNNHDDMTIKVNGLDLLATEAIQSIKVDWSGVEPPMVTIGMYGYVVPQSADEVPTGEEKETDSG